VSVPPLDGGIDLVHAVRGAENGYVHKTSASCLTVVRVGGACSPLVYGRHRFVCVWKGDVYCSGFIGRETEWGRFRVLRLLRVTSGFIDRGYSPIASLRDLYERYFFSLAACVLHSKSLCWQIVNVRPRKGVHKT
jgi:hypothetical protein